MPIYEYKCGGCGEVFEVMQKFSDGPVKKCVHCSSKKVEKLISSSSFILKGGGWYKDGYSNKGSGKPEKKEAAAAKPECAGCPSASK